MLQTYRQVAGCAPSRQDAVYVFAIAPIAERGLAAITSADEVVLLSRDTLSGTDTTVLRDGPKGLNSLAVGDQGRTVMCAGSDGTVAVIDLRAGSNMAQFSAGRAVNTIAWKLNDVAVGSESVVSVWDRRQMKLRWQNTEINDEITALSFHPARDNLLLSGGDDGVVCVFDTTIQEEQDSLVQATNHSPIHKAGFLGPTDLYALSSDQNLALHSLTVDDAEEETDQPPVAPDQLGDLRPIVPCEYVIDVLQSGPDHIVACGSHSHSRVDLIKVDRGVGLDLTQRIVLEGAHGQEVVRSIFVDLENGTIFTAGEDGQVAAFRPQTSGQTSGPTSTPTKGPKSKKGPETRYRPY